MDYEKAYKESFGVAQCLHEAGDTTTKKQMERLFPQLAESKDERIRKWILEKMQVYASSGIPCSDEIKMADKAIDYLEKQKEQKPVVTHGETYRVDTLGTQQVIAGKMPQKPAEWSEDDEKIRKALIWHLKADVDFVSNGVTKAECIAYLDKQKAQKQEWSDEDKRILKGIIGLVDHNQHYNVSNKEMLAWLKSLRPVSKESLQPHWKPSEEQMKAFKGYIEDFQERAEAAVGGWNNYDVMIRLYEQLKKLM